MPGVTIKGAQWGTVVVCCVYVIRMEEVWLVHQHVKNDMKKNEKNIYIYIFIGSRRKGIVTGTQSFSDEAN